MTDAAVGDGRRIANHRSNIAPQLSQSKLRLDRLFALGDITHCTTEDCSTHQDTNCGQKQWFP